MSVDTHMDYSRLFIPVATASSVAGGSGPALSPSVISRGPLMSVPVLVQGSLKQPIMATTTAASSASGTQAASHYDPSQVLNRQRLQDLVREVDPNEQLDEDVEELLLQIADDFIENVVTTSCLLAKHRKSNSLEIKDVQLILERNWNMWIPGFGSEELRPYKKSSTTEAHKQRMALIRKTLKKY